MFAAGPLFQRFRISLDLAAAPLHHGEAAAHRRGEGLGLDLLGGVQRLPGHEDPDDRVRGRGDVQLRGVGVGASLEADQVIGIVLHQGQPVDDELVGLPAGQAQLLTALALLMPYCAKDSAELALRAEHAEKIKAALDYMEKNYGEEIAIADVASACFFSQYHFMRFFKKYMGVSCGEYLKNLRLEKAAQAFAKGETGILDVAMESGFRNLSYFYREFQKKYGYTPKQFIHRCVEMPKE